MFIPPSHYTYSGYLLWLFILFVCPADNFVNSIFDNIFESLVPSFKILNIWRAQVFLKLSSFKKNGIPF